MNPADLAPVQQVAAEVSSAPALQLALLALVGVLYCFVGYRLFKVLLALSGFVLVGGVTGMVASVGFPDSPVIPIIVGALCGLVGAGALLFLYKLGVFVVGAAFGGLVTFQVLQGNPPDWMPWAILGVGLVTGIAALWLEKPMLSLAMASIGAWLMLASVTVLLFGGGDFQLDPESITPLAAWPLFLSWLVLTLFGLATQLGTSRNEVHHHHYYRPKP
ncbi:MAG: DUF4203 domain-containing protein [Candidatus Hydrogenedens sp.]|nr:DUF4203 domain-containing protein [Candidatus Hydrogenedens sp.]